MKVETLVEDDRFCLTIWLSWLFVY